MSQAQEAIEEVAEKVGEYEGELDSFVMERPITALVASLAVGVLLGRLIF